MGCLNSGDGFEHWFANIHFSGPCNRSCYFCIGQHMMALDQLNTLNQWPLVGLEGFIQECKDRNVTEINLTGSNTDPLLYRHIPELKKRLNASFPGLRFGVRTNGARVFAMWDEWLMFDKASISISSFDPDLYVKTMGSGSPPNLRRIVEQSPFPIKVNVVLSPYTLHEVRETLRRVANAGVKVANLREPYGQAHIGNPLASLERAGERYGMPWYLIDGMEVTYWDVHYVHVESVNLYANGRVSLDYPITRGHSPSGEVLGQEHWTTGRHVEQWARI